MDLGLLYKSICSTLKIEQSLQNAFKILGPGFGADGAYINLYDRKERRVDFFAFADGEKAERSDLSVIVPSEIAGRISSFLNYHGNLSDYPFTGYVLSQVLPQAKSFVLLTLKQEGKHLGVVVFWSSKPDTFTGRHAEILKALHDPFSLVVNNAINEILRKANSRLLSSNRRFRESLDKAGENEIRDFLKRSPALKETVSKISKIASYEATVLLLGETGTGKEVLADLLVRLSDRQNKPFLKLNCGALTENLVDAELFGYEKGAFTDAKERKLGFFEKADGGTLFLDEIGELSLAAQVKLLRVLQQKTITRVGGRDQISVDVRVIAATHRDLRKMVREGTFREDLWYRLELFPIPIPPLRKRREDLIPMVEYFAEKFCSKYGKSQFLTWDRSNLEELENYSWPGNIRQLENCVERAVLNSEDGVFELKLPEEEPEGRISEHTLAAPRNPKTSFFADASSLTFEEMQVRYFSDILAKTGGKIFGKGGAAEICGLHPNTLRSRLDKLGISRKQL